LLSYQHSNLSVSLKLKNAAKWWL